MKKIRTLGVLVAISGGLLPVAYGQTVQYTYTGETGGGVVMGIHTGDYNGGALVGQFIMTTANPNFQSTLLTYCTDVNVFLSSPFNYTPTPLSAANGVNPAWISGGIMNAATLWYNDKAGATTATQTAGLQLAIWELLYNAPLTGVNPYTGSIFNNTGNNGFYITSSDSKTISAEGYAAGLLNGLSGLSTEQNVEWLAPTLPNGLTGGSQGLLYQTPGPTTPPNVPDATSTFGLLGLAAAALTAMKRKIFRA
jgi:hypothetical protein